MHNEIVLKPEIIGHIGFLPVTNTMFVSWIVVAILVILSFLISRRVQIIPGTLQNFFEVIVEAGWNQVEELAHSRAKVFFPIVMTFFLYIIVANWLGLFPGFATIVSLISFMLGLVIVMLGLIGEYLWRIFEETNRRPETVIEQVW